MPAARAEEFINALRQLEERGDVEAIIPVFAEDAELSNPTDNSPHRGREGAKEFWGAYRRTFTEIHSEFRNIAESDRAALLEWTSRGRTATGEEFEYEGVSVLEFADDKVRRFRAYFDTATLGKHMEPTSRLEQPNKENVGA